MTAKALIIIATLAIAAFIVGIAQYNFDYPDQRHAGILRPVSMGGNVL